MILHNYNIFAYKNFLFLAGPFGIFRFNFALLFLNCYIAILKGNLFFKLLKKNVSKIRSKFQSSMILFLKQLNTLYIKKLFLLGIGFRCWIFKDYNFINFILLKLGFSRDVSLVIPLCIKLTCLKPTLIFLKSNDKLILEQFAALLCSLKKFNFYKGKGLVSSNKTFSLKLGKKS